MELNRKQLSAILEALRKSPRGMNVTEVARETKMNRATVAKYLEMLYVSGHADMRQFGTSKIYYISQRMPLSAFLNFSSDLIIVLDKDMRVMNANDIFFEFTNTQREDIVHKNTNHFAFPLMFDPPIDPYIVEAINGTAAKIESYYRKKDRGYYFNVKLIPLIFDGGEKGVTIIFEDITEKKIAEKALHEANTELERKVRERTQELEQTNDALRKSEAYLMGAQQIAHLGYWSFNPKTQEINVSDETSRLFGIDPGTLWTYELYKTRVHRDDIWKVEKADLEAITWGKPINIEYRLILPDNKERIIRSIGEVRRDSSGEAIEIFGTLQDVTDQRRLEGVLRESEERYRILTEKSYDIIYSIEPDGTITYASPTVVRYGYCPEDLVNHNILDFIPDDHKEFFCQKLRETLIKGESLPTEFKVRTRDGTEIWVEITGKTIYDDDGKPLFQVGVLRDISERKLAEAALRNSEARFKALFEGASMAILIIDVGTGNITDCNSYAVNLIGRPREEIIGSHHVRLHPAGRLEECRRNTMIHTDDGHVTNFETEMLHKDGRRIPVIINSKLMEINGRKIMMGSYLDITDRKRAEDALRESQEKYRGMVENIQVLIWEINENYLYTYMTPRSKEIMGYEPEEMIGKAPFDFMLQGEMKRIREQVRDLMNEHKPFELLDYYMIRKDGGKVFFKTNCMPVFDDKGQFAGYRGVNRDITNGRK